MPIVDGLTSTKMIRSFEHSRTESHLSPRAAANGRVPIFAVSASLLEREKQKYIEAGFDGWILKPIDFKRLNVLMTGIVDESVRNSCLYTPGDWEAGGWFRSRQENVYDIGMTAPSKRSKDLPSRPRNHPVSTDRNPQPAQSSSDSGSVTPTPSGHSGTKLSNVPRMSLAGEEPTILTQPAEHPVEESLDEETSKTPQPLST